MEDGDVGDGSHTTSLSTTVLTGCSWVLLRREAEAAMLCFDGWIGEKRERTGVPNEDTFKVEEAAEVEAEVSVKQLNLFSKRSAEIP